MSSLSLTHFDELLVDARVGPVWLRHIGHTDRILQGDLLQRRRFMRLIIVIVAHFLDLFVFFVLLRCFVARLQHVASTVHLSSKLPRTGYIYLEMSLHVLVKLPGISMG